MTKVKKYNLEGKEVGEVEVSETLSSAEANSQMVKDYIVAIRENARQWSASTKTRGEVKHTTKKPHKQKGTGRARQGSLVTPQFRGGGIVFGPKPKFNQHVRINKKERQHAIRALIADKIRAGKFIVLDSIAMDEPKTKTVSHFMKESALQGRSLFVSEGNYQEIAIGDAKKTISVKSKAHENFAKSLRNLPKLRFSLAKNISGYDVICAQNLVITEAALQEVEEWLKCKEGV